MHVTALPGRQQPGREVVAAAVPPVQLATSRVRIGQPCHGAHHKRLAFRGNTPNSVRLARVRTVTGATDRVVIVGAGLGGLACALHLTAAGREVTVVERDSAPGGRAGRLTIDGYEFDTGPTVLTMPSLIEEALGAVGEELSDWLDLVRLD